MRDPAEATLIDHVARRRVPYDPLVRLALFGGLLFISPGCVFPVPNVRVEGYGVQSHVVDADSGRPVAGAKVVDASDGRHAARADANGEVRLKPRVQWHFGYLWAVAIGYPVWPFTGDLVRADRTVRVIAAGYDVATFRLSPSRADPERGDGIGDLPVKDDVLLVPSLRIRKRPASQPAAPETRADEAPGAPGGRMTNGGCNVGHGCPSYRRSGVCRSVEPTCLILLVPERTFQPGFRLSPFDVAVLVAGAVASAYATTVDRWFGAAIAFVVLHFFLFCNVLRMSRRLELVWAGVFAALAVAALSFNVLSWPAVFAASAALTAIVAAIELRRPSYHGVGWQKLNPRLPEWWQSAAGAAGAPPPGAARRGRE
jgi:hypothetical protein